MINKTSTIIKYSLMFLSIFLPLRDFTAFYLGTYMKFLPDILIYFLLFLVLFKNNFKFNLKKCDYIYLLFLLVGLISTLLNGISLISYLIQFRSITTMYILFYVLRNCNISFDDYKKILRILMIISCILIFFSIIEVISNKCLFFPLEWAHNIPYKSNFLRAYSLINNPNIFAMFILFVVVLHYYIIDKKYTKMDILFYFISFLGIFITASRSALICLFVFLIYIFLVEIKTKNIKKILIFSVTIALSLLLYIFLSFLRGTFNISCEASKVLLTTSIISNNETNNNYYSEPGNYSIAFNFDKLSLSEEKIYLSINQQKENDNTQTDISIVDRWNEIKDGITFENSMKNGRLFHIVKGFEILKDYPIFGTGFGTFGSSASLIITPKLYEKYELYKGFYADNEYIKVIVETGIVGVLLYILFILNLFKTFCKEKYSVLVFVIFLTMGLFYNIFEIQILSFLFYIILSVIKVKERK